MTIGVVGNYSNFAPQAPAPLPAGGAQPALPPLPGAYGQDAYTAAPPAAQAAPPAAMAYPAYPTQPTPAARGANIGRLASWGAGALGAARLVLPHLASGWLKIAAVLGGALVGNLVWNKFENEVRADKAGGVGHVGTMAAGGAGAFLIGRHFLGAGPQGWIVGGIVAAGAFIGHKVFAAINPR